MAEVAFEEGEDRRGIGPGEILGKGGAHGLIHRFGIIDTLHRLVPSPAVAPREVVARDLVRKRPALLAHDVQRLCQVERLPDAVHLFGGHRDGDGRTRALPQHRRGGQGKRDGGDDRLQHHSSWPGFSSARRSATSSNRAAMISYCTAFISS